MFGTDKEIDGRVSENLNTRRGNWKLLYILKNIQKLLLLLTSRLINQENYIIIIKEGIEKKMTEICWIKQKL